MGPAVLDEHMVDSRGGANLRAEMARRIGDYPAYRSHAAAGKSPGTKSTVKLAHVVVQQDIGGTGRPRPHEGPDDAAGGHGCLQYFGIKPFVQKICRAYGHQLCHFVEKLLPE